MAYDIIPIYTVVKVDGDRPSQKVAKSKGPWETKTNGRVAIAIYFPGGTTLVGGWTNPFEKH